MEWNPQRVHARRLRSSERLLQPENPHVRMHAPSNMKTETKKQTRITNASIQSGGKTCHGSSAFEFKHQQPCAKIDRVGFLFGRVHPFYVYMLSECFGWAATQHYGRLVLVLIHARTRLPCYTAQKSCTKRAPVVGIECCDLALPLRAFQCRKQNNVEHELVALLPGQAYARTVVVSKH